MYLSKIPLNPRRLATQRLLDDRRAMHAAVLGGIPDQPVPAHTADGARVLWRIDDDEPRRPIVLALTPQRPDFMHLAEQAGWPAAELPFATRDYEPLLSRLAPDQTYLFRLTANATHSVPPDGATGRVRGKRFAHVTHVQQLKWLVDRAPGMGLRLPQLAMHDQPDVAVIRRAHSTFRHDRGRVTLGLATFQGRLQVADPDRLRHVLTNGVGPGKAYGCGLLTLAPTR